jgi:hypothetical protein
VVARPVPEVERERERKRERAMDKMLSKSRRGRFGVDLRSRFEDVFKMSSD